MLVGDAIGSMVKGETIVSTVIPTAVDAGDSFEAASVAFAVMLCEPSVSVDDVIDQVVRLSRGMEPMEVELESNITIEVSATFVPLIVGVEVVTVAPLAGLVIAGADSELESGNVPQLGYNALLVGLKICCGFDPSAFITKRLMPPLSWVNAILVLSGENEAFPTLVPVWIVVCPVPSGFIVHKVLPDCPLPGALVNITFKPSGEKDGSRINTVDDEVIDVITPVLTSTLKISVRPPVMGCKK